MKYAKVNSLDELKTVQYRKINPSRCPHYIMVGEHYREDRSCKCDDPNERVMRKWGYRWNKTKKQWTS